MSDTGQFYPKNFDFTGECPLVTKIANFFYLFGGRVEYIVKSTSLRERPILTR